MENKYSIPNITNIRRLMLKYKKNCNIEEPNSIYEQVLHDGIVWNKMDYLICSVDNVIICLTCLSKEEHV